MHCLAALFQKLTLKSRFILSHTIYWTLPRAGCHTFLPAPGVTTVTRGEIHCTVLTGKWSLFSYYIPELHIPVRQRKWRWNRISRWNIWRREYGNGQMAIKGCSQQWFIKIPTLSRHTLFDRLLCEDILRVPFYFFRVRNCEGITRNERMINFPIVYQSRYIGLISLGKAWYRETSEGESGGMVGRGEG